MDKNYRVISKDNLVGQGGLEELLNDGWVIERVIGDFIILSKS